MGNCQGSSQGQTPPSMPIGQWLTGGFVPFQKLKKDIMPLVRGNKGDDTMLNSGWRKIWVAAKRFFTPKIGQVTNSRSAIDRIVREATFTVHLRPTDPPFYLSRLRRSTANSLHRLRKRILSNCTSLCFRLSPRHSYFKPKLRSQLRRIQLSLLLG